RPRRSSSPSSSAISPTGPPRTCPASSCPTRGTSTSPRRTARTSPTTPTRRPRARTCRTSPRGACTRARSPRRSSCTPPTTRARALRLGASARPSAAPLAPPPHRDEITAGYDAAWAAIVRALAKENVALRAIARDSGVIASDDFVAPIGVYADCGRIGDDLLEGEALVSFTLFVEPNGTHTNVQINSRMLTHMYRRGGSGKFRTTPVF